MTEHYTESKGDADMWRGYINTGDQDQTPKMDTVRALDVAYEIHRALVEGQFNNYTWWYIRRDYGPIKNSGANAGKVSKRGHCMAQYARFVRPGFVRVSATKEPAAHMYVSAFKKGDSVVVAVVNRNVQRKLDFTVPLAKGIVSWRKYTTSSSKNVQDDGLVTATNGAFSTSFDQESITTLVGVSAGSSAVDRQVRPLPASGSFRVTSLDGRILGTVRTEPGQDLASAIARTTAARGLVLVRSLDDGESWRMLLPESGR